MDREIYYLLSDYKSEFRMPNSEIRNSFLGAPGETRTHNPLLKRQVPWSDLATDARHCRLAKSEVLRAKGQGKRPTIGTQLLALCSLLFIRQSKIGNVLAGLTRLELAISASTVQRFTPTKLQP